MFWQIHRISGLTKGSWLPQVCLHSTCCNIVLSGKREDLTALQGPSDHILKICSVLVYRVSVQSMKPIIIIIIRKCTFYREEIELHVTE